MRAAQWPTASGRAAAQNVVPTAPIIQSPAPYLNMNTITSMPQQQPQQQHTPAMSSAKPRSKAVKIVDPTTMKEININDDDPAKVSPLSWVIETLFKIT